MLPRLDGRPGRQPSFIGPFSLPERNCFALQEIGQLCVRRLGRGRGVRPAAAAASAAARSRAQARPWSHRSWANGPRHGPTPRATRPPCTSSSARARASRTSRRAWLTSAPLTRRSRLRRRLPRLLPDPVGAHARRHQLERPRRPRAAPDGTVLARSTSGRSRTGMIRASRAQQGRHFPNLAITPIHRPTAPVTRTRSRTTCRASTTALPTQVGTAVKPTFPVGPGGKATAAWSRC